MNRRGGFGLVLFAVMLFIVFFMLAFFYFAVPISLSSNVVKLENPTFGVSTQQSLEDFDESYIEYLFYEIGADGIRNGLVEVEVDGEVYGAVIFGGEVYVEKSGLERRDIYIKTSKIEIIKMIQDNSYIRNSLHSGKTTIDTEARTGILLSKGYLLLYWRLR